jgi:hypothetical protein
MYYDVLKKTLQDYQSLFQKTLKTFLEYQTLEHPESNIPTLIKLRTQIQSAMIKLVDQQHNFEFIISYNRFSPRDMSRITQRVKDMRTPLHGIGVSLLMKHERSQNKEHYESTEDKMFPNVPIYEEIIPTTESLTDACVLVLQSCAQRIEGFKVPPRSLLSTILWPFPRLFVRTKQPPSQDLHIDLLEQRINVYETAMRDWRIKHVDAKLPVTRQVEYLFQFNMILFANSVRALGSLIDELERTRPQRKRLWMPCLSVRRWLKPSLSNKGRFGNQVNHRILSIAESIEVVDKEDKPAELNQVVVEQADICLMNTTDKPPPRDPDINAPTTKRERFFDGIAKLIDWCYSESTVFALKTALGFILLSLPAYLPQSVGWFTSWGGQWVANTLLMWMIPITGMFNFT